MAEPNIYLPHLMRIAKVTDEASAVKTFRLEFVNPEDADNFDFNTGQFGLYSAFGEGESTFCIASSPTRKGYIECTFRAVGRVTTALAAKEEGDIIGFRGPYGNLFPIEEWRGKNLLFVAGGIALPPLRSVIWNCLDQRDWFQDISVVYGARRVADLVYKYELRDWQERSDIELAVTVDPGGETHDWRGKVGFVPHIIEQLAPRSENTIAIVCGPPMMIKHTLPLLERLGFTSECIYTTLENRMKCGLGKCGRCNTGKSFICKDGPVYTLAQLAGVAGGVLVDRAVGRAKAHALPDTFSRFVVVQVRHVLCPTCRLRCPTVSRFVAAHAGLSSLGSGFLVGSVLQLIPVQIDDGKAQITIPSNQLTVFDAKGREFCWIEIDP